MSPDVSADALVDAASSLSEPAQHRLLELLESSPHTLEAFLLQDEGQSDVAVNAEDVTDPDEAELLEELTATQRELYDCVSGLPMPASRAEVKEFLDDSHPEFVDEHKSARHQSWLSQQLNSLVEVGLIGRYRHERKVKYTPTVEKAIQDWLTLNRPLSDDLSLDDTDEIARDTGMPWPVVRRTLRTLADA